MDPVRIGMDVRLLRHQRGWTQEGLAARSGVSRMLIVRLEAGRADVLDLGAVARVVSALGGYLSVRVLYRGEGLDRLRDRRHAALVDRLVRLLVRAGWVVEPEVSFNVFGERGAIDILAFHPETGSLLVVEVKSTIPDVGGMLATLDRKVRHADRLARDRGWVVRDVSKLLAVSDTRTARRRVERHSATFDAVFPARTVAARRWVQQPAGPIAALMFLAEDQGRDSKQTSARRTGFRGPHLVSGDPARDG